VEEAKNGKWIVEKRKKWPRDSGRREKMVKR
jgi:hypothetical protein